MSHRQTIPRLKTFYGYSCGNCGHEPLFSTQHWRDVNLATHQIACMTSTPMPQMYRTEIRLPVT